MLLYIISVFSFNTNSTQLEDVLAKKLYIIKEDLGDLKKKYK